MKNIFTYNEMLADVKTTLEQLKPFCTDTSLELYRKPVGHIVDNLLKHWEKPGGEHQTYHIFAIKNCIHVINRPDGCSDLRSWEKPKYDTICWKERVFGVWVKSIHKIYGCFDYWKLPLELKNNGKNFSR